MNINRKLRMGMVGGGYGAFIGDIHRKAARLEGVIGLVAGVFDVDPKKSKEMGIQLGLEDRRLYHDYKEMIQVENSLDENKKIEFVTIVTPNNCHFPIARDFLNNGFHVLCEKPMTINLEQAFELHEIVKKTKKIFALMHNYTGYPMVKLAKDIVHNEDEFGKIRKVVVHYTQDWLSTPLERTGQQQASWRTDPKQSGAGCVGDIGSHAANLAEYITGMKIIEVCPSVHTFIEGRKVEDDCNCLIKLENGIHGVLFSSQISVGEENNLAIWIYGEKQSIEWHQENPNYLIVKSLNKPIQIYTRGQSYIKGISESAQRATRIPPGHPEGFIEAFANVYNNFTDAVRKYNDGKDINENKFDFPNVQDGVRGMAFIDAVLRGKQSNEKWIKLKC